MAGSFVSLELRGEEQIAQALNNLLTKSSDLSPAFKDIGEHLIESTQQRFFDQETPDGEAWEPLSELTLSRKTRTDKILTESSTLSDTLNYQLGSDELHFGSPLEYAAMMHFGGTTSPDSMFPNKEISARAFLGISDDDEDEILAILKSYLV